VSLQPLEKMKQPTKVSKFSKKKEKLQGKSKLMSQITRQRELAEVVIFENNL